jgi:hypothetical protein
MHHHDLSSLSFLARERHDQRLREADAERLARMLHDASPTRRALPPAFALSPKATRRGARPRLNP